LGQLAPLGLNLGYLFLQIVGFVLLVLALNFILYRPLLRALANRRERIAEGLNQARQAEEALMKPPAASSRMRARKPPASWKRPVQKPLASGTACWLICVSRLSR
jgi:flagellar biosynthesis/type III secretory pathway M-ring protein FliF/YscJ